MKTTTKKTMTFTRSNGEKVTINLHSVIKMNKITKEKIIINY